MDYLLLLLLLDETEIHCQGVLTTSSASYLVQMSSSITVGCLVCISHSVLQVFISALASTACISPLVPHVLSSALVSSSLTLMGGQLRLKTLRLLLGFLVQHLVCLQLLQLTSTQGPFSIHHSSLFHVGPQSHPLYMDSDFSGRSNSNVNAHLFLLII